MRTIGSIALLLLLFTGTAAAQAGKGKPWIGVNLEVVENLPAIPGLKAKAGVRLTVVQPGSPGARSGLRPGDIVVSAGGVVFNTPADKTLPLFISIIQRYSPGEVMPVQVIRDVVALSGRSGKQELTPEQARDPDTYLEEAPPGTTLSIEGSKERRLVPINLRLGSRTGTVLAPLPPVSELRPGLSETHPALRKLAEQAAEHAGMTGRMHDLRTRLGRLHEAWDGFCPSLTAVCHRNPFLAEAAARATVNELNACAQAGPGALPRLLRAMARTGDVRLDPLPKRILHTGISPESHARQIHAWIEAVSEELIGAFARLSADEKRMIARHRLGVSEQFVKHIYLHADEDPKRLERNLAIIQAARKVDKGALYRAAILLSQLAAPEYLSALRADLLKAFGKDAGARVLLRRSTRMGDILFAGTGNHWHKEAGVCVLVDLGGDDFHTQSTTGGNEFARPVGLVLDLGGDDAYASTTEQALGSGSLGVSLLVDTEGNDRYTATRWAQGTGFFGVGVVADWAGNDVYRGEELCQAVGCVGAGLLADYGGHDRYEGKKYNQGVGMPGGVGLLLDLAGNDEYYGKGRYPSGYGTHGVFEGWSQGCAVGFRQYASGGVGLLLDGAGADAYEAGNFSQGGGYYYGTGILVDSGEENDQYIGSRYNQGFSAHQAVGVFIEEGGHDVYRTRNGVAQGLAWDECVTLFIEEGGDDLYEGGSGFSQAASAHNAFCLFWDKGGRDRYVYPKQARAGGNTYHGGTSFSLFIDQGGGEDTYRQAESNNAARTGPEDFLFLDLPGTAKEAAQNRAWEALWKGVAIPPVKKKK